METVGDNASGEIMMASADDNEPDIQPECVRIGNKIKELQNLAKAQQEQRKAIQKELKNARTRRSRLMKKTKGLSSADLMELMAERGAREAASGVSPSPAVGDGVSGATGSGSGSGYA